MRKDYTKPETREFQLNMPHAMLAGSLSESIDKAEDMDGGGFGSRRRGGLWDDDED